MNYSFDYVTFESIDDNQKIVKDDYDDTTNEKYRTMRLYKIDPIMNEEIPNYLTFELSLFFDFLLMFSEGVYS